MQSPYSAIGMSQKSLDACSKSLHPGMFACASKHDYDCAHGEDEWRKAQYGECAITHYVAALTVLTKGENPDSLARRHLCKVSAGAGRHVHRNCKRQSRNRA